MTLLAVVVVAASTAVAGLRWLRVAQREHYLPGFVSRFAARWWRCRVDNVAVLAVAVAGAVVAAWVPLAALGTAVAVGVGPLGLSVRGRTAPLAWTRRLRTLAVAWAVLQGAVIAVGWWAGAPVVAAAVGAVAAPVVVDAALAVTGPVERALTGRYVTRAAERLRRVHPTVVAITGSYGKTSTKGYVAHLVGGARTVVATPASFNNRAGLARSVNEHLTPGTEVFVAEMGTYGPGEIARLCAWVPPDVAVITAIGPVHLERFRSEDRIVVAKSEILERAPVVVLAADDPRLAAVADRCQAQGKQVWRARRGPVHEGTVDDRTVVVEVTDDLARVTIGTRLVADAVPCTAPPSNVACAVAVAAALGVDDAVVAARLAGLPTAAHRLEPAQGPSGATVLDDTYNANPAGAAAALSRMAALAGSAARRVVVTPGMVELGPRQRAENERFAEAAAAVATDVVVVGRTNRRALVTGARRTGRAEVHVVDRRDEAVAWVRATVGPGDVVLYENDLPDHYP